MWNWKPAKVMLEALFSAGEVVIAGRVRGFQRVYDLPERVLPREVLNAPSVSEDDSCASSSPAPSAREGH